jgi:hypothetical protein
MAAFMRHQQTKAVQHNGVDKANRFIMAWLTFNNRASYI